MFFPSDFICNLCHILLKMGVLIQAEANEQFILIIAVCSTVEDFSWKIVLDRHAIAFEPFNLISSAQTIRSHFAANVRTWSTAVRPDYMREQRSALSEREYKTDNTA